MLSVAKSHDFLVLSFFVTTTVRLFLLPLSSLTSLAPWQLALIIHSCVVLLLWRFAQKLLSQKVSISQLPWVLPSLLVLLGTFSLTLVDSSGVSKPLHYRNSIYFLVLIPLVEEVVYRGYLSFHLQKRYGIFWGAYLSSVFFALMHVQIDLNNFSLLSLGVPIGPLLLAWSCEWIYHHSRNIAFPLLFHVSCNATAVILQIFGPVWLDRLQILYLSVEP